MNNINIDKIIETITYYWVTTYFVKILAAILIFIIGKWLAGKISRLITKLLEKNKVDITLVTFLENIIYYTFLIVVRPWVKTSEYWSVYFDLTEKIKITFDAEGISIPYPQQDVHLYNTLAHEK